MTKIFTKTIEEEASKQIEALSKCPAYKDSQIRIMPDAHAGAGCTIGTTMTLHSKVTPNLVGVDIGCGMLCVKLNIGSIDCQKLDKVIRENIPAGFNIHNKIISNYSLDLLCKDHINMERIPYSLGTLGGGNHFIEVDYSEKDKCYYLVIHTGSRNLGVQVCKYYQDKAIHNIKQNSFERDLIIKTYKLLGKEREIQSELNKIKKLDISNELAYVQDVDFIDYIHDMEETQKWAKVNRFLIADIITTIMDWNIEDMFHTIHNYIDTSNLILRKGAVSAQKGEKLIIPMNMRDGSLICIGKGNPDWNYSAPHGAGRLMSRTKAKETLSMEDFKKSMSDVYSTSVDESTLDESPMVYKPMEEIIECIKPTVDIVDIIKPVYNFKAGEK